jgi:hypothetical protein
MSTYCYIFGIGPPTNELEQTMKLFPEVIVFSIVRSELSKALQEGRNRRNAISSEAL